MDHSQLWQSILDTLQQELPRASFETWLRDTRSLSFQDNTLSVQACNSLARDWLESRVTDLVTARLSELAQPGAQIRFVVEEAGEEEQPEALEEAGGDSRFSAEAVVDTEYQHEVHPERVVVFDGYALRLLEHGEVTPKGMSIWIGMRQAVYNRQKQGQSVVKNIPYWEALRFAKMSKSSFFREIANRESIADGLVEIVPVPAEPVNDRRFDHANRYLVRMSPRLTRRDCAVVQELLRREVCMAASQEEAETIMRRTLQTLIDSDLGEYLEQFPKLSAPEHQARTLAEVARVVLDVPELPAEVRKLAESLTNRILRGFGKVLITHYFLQEVVQRYNLTHPQIWAIIALRDRCWYDHDTRTQKEFALVRGGLTELGAWVGVDRKTVRRWLQDPSFAQFVQLTDAAAMNLSPEWVGTRTVFHVRQAEPVEGEGGWDKMRHDAGQSEYRPGTKCDTVRDKVRHEVGQNASLLNNLNQPQDSPSKPQASPPAPLPPRRAGSRSFWELDFLFENNRVNHGSRKHLLRTNKTRWGRDLKALSAGLVSWLLYAYSPEGRGVNDPIGLALRRLNENAHPGAGGAFDRLARLNPYALRALFDADLAGLEADDSPEADAYRANFAALLPEHKRDLYGRLFGAEA